MDFLRIEVVLSTQRGGLGGVVSKLEFGAHRDAAGTSGARPWAHSSPE